MEKESAGIKMENINNSDCQITESNLNGIHNTGHAGKVNEIWPPITVIFHIVH